MTTEAEGNAEVLAERASFRVDGLCDRFESVWTSGDQPRIKDFLDGLEDTEFGIALRELLALELELHQADGKEPTPEGSASRFPEQDAAVASVFAAGSHPHDRARIGTVPDGPTNSTFADQPPAN